MSLPKTPPRDDEWPLDAVRALAAERRFELAPREPALLAWLSLLITWNARMDLTAARSLLQLVDLMLADAVVLASVLPQEAKTVDVGSGAGAPGLPLCILRPDLKMTLCEPLQKRTAFLRTVLGTLKRNDVTLMVGKGEALPRASFDVALSRATLAPPAWLELGVSLAVPGGEVDVLLARDAVPETAGAAKLEEIAYASAGVSGESERRLVRYRKG
jgi:16S rRNA (guanine527-N7)-methyltransferase